MKRIFCALTLALLSTTAFAAESTQSANPILIGVIGPYTGGSSGMGLSMLNGVRLAANEINFKGGILGRPVALIERDDQAMPEVGAKIAQEFVTKDKPAAVVGFVNTGVALAAQKYLQEAKIPVLTNVSAGAALTKQFLPPKYPDNYIFRNSASDAIQSEMVVHEAIERRKFKRVAIFTDVTAYGQQGKELMLAALTKRGIAPVTIEQFKIGDTDMSAQLDKARKSGAEALLCWGIGPELAAVANNRARMGWQVPMIGGWTLSLTSFIENAGVNGNGVRMPQTFIAEPTTSRHTSFITTYLSTYNVTSIPSAVSASQGYDSLLLLAAAMQQAKSTEGPLVRAALENLKEKVYGVITTYDHPYTKDDHEAISDNLVITGEVQNSHVTYAYRDDEKQAIIRRKQTVKKP
jgi:branched-chain amino acid transport system substrate-binding protein